MIFYFWCVIDILGLCLCIHCTTYMYIYMHVEHENYLQKDNRGCLIDISFFILYVY